MHGLRFKKNMPLKLLSSFTLICLASVIFLLINLVTQADGAYSKEANFAVIFTKDLNMDRLVYVSLHELGHYIYFKKLNDIERKQYEQLFNDSNIYITDYSMTNAAENFAEEFAAKIQCYYISDNGSNDRNYYFNKIVRPIIDINNIDGRKNE